MNGLEDELAAAVCNLPPATIGRLRSFGIPESVIFDLPLMVGVAKVQTLPSGFYEPNDVGAPAVIVAAGLPAPPIWDTLDDLIAFRPQDPGRWWRCRGEVQVLGSGNIRPEPVFPLTLHDTPLSWLQAGASGVCVIDWRVDPERFLYAGPIEAESPSLKARLERRIQSAALAKFNISVSEISNAA
jgi:hypothetical protein